MYTGREDENNIFSSVNFWKFCNIRIKFPELRYYFYSFVRFKSHWKAKKYLDKLQKYVDQIDTKIYPDYIIDERYFYGDCINIRANEIKITCSALYQKQFLQII